MKRYKMDLLAAWKDDKKRKPLIIRGARQVGKTWLMKEFGRLYFDACAYIDFNNNKRMQVLFEGDFAVPRIIEGLQAETGILIDPQKTLIVFDEVQEVPKALTSLKYFYENASEYAIIAGGSLLGVGLHEGTSFPVGKVDFCNLYPLCYQEFLEAIGEENLARLLQKRDWRMISVFADKYIDYLRKYYYIGGMPEAAADYAENKDYDRVRRIQEQILFTYENDFSKHAPYSIVPRLRGIWDSAPAQLARENKKFSPGIIRKGSRLAEYETALQWLSDGGMIYCVKQLSKPGLPLAAYETSNFKLYVHDVGLLSAKSGLDAKVLLEGSRIFEEFKGALTEQYVLQELIANGIKPYYWSSEGKAEVDFVFGRGGDVYPLEVKAAENLQAKSLKVYYEKYSPAVCYRMSMREYRNDGWLTNIPLYAAGTDFVV